MIGGLVKPDPDPTLAILASTAIVSSSKGRRSYANTVPAIRNWTSSVSDMSRTSADRRLDKGNQANLYAGNTALGWRVVRQVPITLGLKKVAQSKWRLLQFEDGGIAGFQTKEGLGPTIPDGILPGWSPTTITAKESQMNAGLYGPSQTRGMGEWLKQRDLKNRLT